MGGVRCAVTGATGLLGGNLAVALLDAGHEVVATKRRSSDASHLDAFDIQWVDASLADPSSLAPAFKGADVVFHCAAAVSVRFEVKPWIYDANVTGTKNIIRAVRDAAVPRLVHCSTVGAVGLSPDGLPSTEEREWNLAEYGLDDAYVTTKREAEDLVHAAVADGLNAVIVNPTYMIGPYDSKPSSGRLVVAVIRRKLPGRAPGMNNFVDVRDVAAGMILAWEKGATGQRYILGGHDMSYNDFIDAVARIAGVKPPSFVIPRWVATIIGKIGDLHSAITDSEPLVNTATVGWGFSDRFIFSSAKAEQQLGYAISPIEPAIEDAIAWFRESAMI